MNNFLDLPQDLANYSKARFVVIPFPLEQTTSYGKGTKHGPAAVLTASAQVELWDEENWCDPSKVGIATILPIPKVKKDHGEALEQLASLTAQVYQDNKFPIVVGGEHSLTSGSIAGLLRAGLLLRQSADRNDTMGGVTIFHFDAHADLRDEWEGSKNSHACALRRAFELSPLFNLVQVGIRNISESEIPFWKEHQKTGRIKTFFAHDKVTWKIRDMIKACKDTVYLTFDIDAIDPSIMPSTGTPEPGGLLWDETLAILRTLAKERNIIGADFNEFSPIKNFPAPDFLGAKLIYKFIGYVSSTVSSSGESAKGGRRLGDPGSFGPGFPPSRE